MLTAIRASTEAFAEERANGHAPSRRRRTPVLAHIARFAGRHLPRASEVRTLALSLVGFGGPTYAAWLTDTRLGLLALGASALVMEYLSAPKEPG